MKLVERHIFVNRQDLDRICFLSKNLYNYCNYILRQSYFKDGRLPREYNLSGGLAKAKQVDYISLPAQTSQQVIKLLYRNWKSFYNSIKDYKKNPNKYKSKPKLPKFKHKVKGRNVVIFANNQCRIKNGYIHFPKKANIKSIKTNIKILNQVRIVPNTTCCVVEVVYEKEIKEDKDLDKNLYLGIDLGVNNLATLVTNTVNVPLLVNGKIIKSMNQYYNKKKSKLMSYVGDKGISNRLKKLDFKRSNLINNYMHHTSRFIVDYCLKYHIKNIVIGYNKGWKQDVNIGKVNNQKFVSIPFLKLIQQIEYKSKLVGISVQTMNESHTSKCDSLALEDIKHHDKYLGKRAKRWLFKSSIGKYLNADVNGAINILRKVIGNDFVKSMTDRGIAFMPVTINPL